MAVPSGVYKTASVVGILENLSSVVSNIAPLDTLLFSKIGNHSEEATQTKQEWLIDTLRAAAANVQPEGDDRTPSSITPATRVYNMQQTLSVTFRISDAALKAKSPGGGVSKEAYQSTLHTKYLAKDSEFAIWRGIRNDTDDGIIGFQMRGALAWMITNVNMASDATLNSTTGVVTGGTNRELVGTLLKDIHEDIYNAGGDADTLFCSSFQARKISGIAGFGNYRQMVEKGKVNDYVDSYQTEFGVINVKIHRNFPTDVVALMDMSQWKKSVYRPAHRRRLAKTGDSEIFDITEQFTLIALQEAASGRITNLLSA